MSSDRVSELRSTRYPLWRRFTDVIPGKIIYCPRIRLFDIPLYSIYFPLVFLLASRCLSMCAQLGQRSEFLSVDAPQYSSPWRIHSKGKRNPDICLSLHGILEKQLHRCCIFDFLFDVRHLNPPAPATPYGTLEYMTLEGILRSLRRHRFNTVYCTRCEVCIASSRSKIILSFGLEYGAINRIINSTNCGPGRSVVDQF